LREHHFGLIFNPFLRRGFIARIGIALEEADESALWLEILREVGIDSTAAHLERESGELSAIFAASRITAQSTLKSI
jgi:four helix bundle protein